MRTCAKGTLRHRTRGMTRNRNPVKRLLSTRAVGCSGFRLHCCACAAEGAALAACRYPGMRPARTILDPLWTRRPTSLGPWSQALSMVILQILAPAEFGGLERVVQGLARGLRRRGHEMHVAAVLDGGRQQHPFLGALRASDVAVYPIELPRRAYLRERRATAALCGRVQPDVVHTHGYRPDVVDATAARRCGVPVVTTVHGFTAGGWKNRLYEALQQRALRRFDVVVAVSRPLARLLARTRGRAGPIEVLPDA